MDEFGRDERLEREKSLCMDYANLFEGREGKNVLADLKQFCGANSLCFHLNDRQEAFMLGTRSVWLYIQERISMDSLKRLNLNTQNDISVKSSSPPPSP